MDEDFGSIVGGVAGDLALCMINASGRRDQISPLTVLFLSVCLSFFLFASPRPPPFAAAPPPPPPSLRGAAKFLQFV